MCPVAEKPRDTLAAKGRHWGMPMRRTVDAVRWAIRAVGLIAVDTVFVAAVAYGLWVNGHHTIADGSVGGYILIVAMGAGILAVRPLLMRGLRLRAEYTTTRDVLAVEMLGLAGLFVAWQLTALYYLGWVLCVASFAFLIACVVQLMTQATVDTVNLPRGARARSLPLIGFWRLGGALVGGVGIFATTPIHEWRVDIMNTTVFVTAAAILLSLLWQPVVGALRRRTLTARSDV